MEGVECLDIQKENLFWKSLVDSASDAIISLGKSLDGTIEMWSRGAEKLYGYSAKEVVGRNITLLVPPGYPNDVPEILARVKRGDRLEDYETTRRKKDGTIVHVSLNVSPIRSAEGEVIGASAIARNITERKLLQKERQVAHNLAESLNRINDLIHSTLDFDEIMRRVADEAAGTIGSEVFAIGLFEGEDYVVSYPCEKIREMSGWRFPLSQVWEAEIALELQDVAVLTEPRKAKQLSLEPIRGLGIKAMLVAPLIIKEEAIGLLNFYYYEHQLPHPALHVDFAKKLANAVSLAVENARLYQKVALSEEESRRSMQLAENRLREIQNLYVTAPIGLSFMDHELRFVNVNAKMAELTGFPAEELYGRTLREVLPEMADLLEPVLRRVFETGEPVTDLEIGSGGERSPQGERCWLINYYPLKIEGGKLLGVNAVVLDITERKRAEEDLRESEERFRAMVEASSEVLYRMSPDWSEMRQLHSRRFLAETGEPTQSWLQEYIFLEDQPYVWSAIEEAIRAKSIFELEHRVIRADGTVGWTFSRAVPLLDKNGEIREWFGAASDITHRKRAEEALQESEARLNSMASAALDAIILIDNDGYVSFWNDAATKIFGYTSEEILGKYLHNLIMPQRHFESFREGFARFRLTGEGPLVGKIYEVEAIRKDGTEFPAEVSLASLWLKGKWNAIGIVRDITGRKQTEEELQKAQRIESIGLLAGGIAHDFNNILTGILGNISLARTFLPPGDKADERLKAAEQASMRARGLSQQLLTFAKGGAPVRKTIILPVAIMETVELAIRGSGVRAENFFPSDLRSVEADEGQLNQAINNLAINAIQAMPEGGALSVAAANVSLPPDNHLGLAAGEYVRVDFKDQGIGIPEELQRKIFDPFFTTKERGSGLGLSISFSIIKRHGGTITVDSRPRAGSTFSIFLPASKAVMGEPPKERQEKIMQGRGRILVMDDEETVSEIAAEMLQHLGYRTETVRDGAEAITAYRQAIAAGEPFDVVITDLTIPGGMGGKETVQRLLAIDPQAKVIVSSGYGNDPIMSNFAEHGFKGVIPKPYRLDELGQKLREVLGGKE